MAVPFNIPEEQNEVEVIINQLQALLSKLEVAVRQNQGNSSVTLTSSVTSRVRNPGSRVRSRDARAAASTLPTQNNTSSALPDLLQNLSWLAMTSRDSVASSQLTARSPRRRTSSDSTCDETKISITAIVKHGCMQDWNQIELADQPKTFSADGFLSKLVPSTVSSCSLWTAMICFVGWHIFKAR